MQTLNIALFLLLGLGALGQHGNDGVMHFSIAAEGKPVPFATIEVPEADRVFSTDLDGTTTASGFAWGTYRVVVRYLGHLPSIQHVVLSPASPAASVEADLQPDPLQLEQAVVTGTRTFQRRTDAPIMVGIIGAQTLERTQSCDLSEGLNFQPGLRVETDCQTCNYTQLRINGLGGGYSQILINGRPLFSPLTGLYGLEQIPTTLVDRIEVVRGAGSALYGSSAIGGTVNVMTRIPEESQFSLGQTVRHIGGQAWEQQFTGLGTLVVPGKDLGISLFLNQRDRQAYDHNGDGFSELTQLNTTASGLSLFWRMDPRQKLEFSLTHTHEERYGGELVDAVPHLTQQAEQRTHRVTLVSLDYQKNNADRTGSFIAYLGAQRTDRDHFTGVAPDDPLELADYISNAPYGQSLARTLQGGVQVNRLLTAFEGRHVVTLGTEAIADDINDRIEAYDFLVDQTTLSAGVFAQSDWQFRPKWTLLTGVRADAHNLVEGPVVSPRLSLMFKPHDTQQFRVSAGRGFRAPQAFDADLHIAFAGGGVSRISLDPDLAPEYSSSLSASWNADWIRSSWIAGVTVEGFYTRLENVFVLAAAGQDDFGLRFEKQNGLGAKVRGLTIETRANLVQKCQLEAGLTLQRSTFDAPVENIEGLAGRTNFLRTPDAYGFGNLQWMPSKTFNATVGLVYTGRMEVAHFSGAPEQAEDAYVITDPFWVWNLRLAKQFAAKWEGSFWEVSAGVRNLNGAYQNDFDTGKNRDSNFVYGPGAPRTLVLGVKFSV